MTPILPVSSIIAPILAPSIGGGSSAAGEAFRSVLNDAVQKVESFRHTADASVNNFLSGDGEEISDVALKTQQAELSFDLFLQARNKVVSAYEEVMRMQV